MFVRMTDRVWQRFCKAIVAWGGLRHPNVLPLLGVTMAGHRFVMVSEWMEYGNINEFVKEHPDKNRPRLVCFSSRSSSSPFTDMFMTAVACRRYQGADIYARPRNHPWKSPGGAYSNHNVSYLVSSLTRP